MWAGNLSEKYLDKIRGFKGEKTLDEITAIFFIENKGHRALRNNLIKNKIPFKEIIKSDCKIENNPPLPKIEIGEEYSFERRRKKNKFYKQAGKVVEEYKRFWLCKKDNGVPFTIQKYPVDYIVKGIADA